ncbi:hypothetical protein COOONC_21542 [Cooperia oncophora]
MLQKPDFQIMKKPKKKDKKERSSKKGSQPRNGHNDSSQQGHQSKMRYKEACKCQDIRNDPKLKTKVCIIL